MALKQDIAREVDLPADTPGMQREMEKLMEENRALRDEVDRWRAGAGRAAVPTNAPPNYAATGVLVHLLGHISIGLLRDDQPSGIDDSHGGSGGRRADMQGAGGRTRPRRLPGNTGSSWTPCWRPTRV